MTGEIEKVFSPAGDGKVYWTSTARSALRPVLLHLRRTGALPDKNAELLVPHWVCTCLYNTVHKVCYPTIQDTPALRGVLVYHQYGFPQKLDRILQRCRDRGMFAIENAVNCAFDGEGVAGMGSAGIATIFSLPKMFSTVLGGALAARDADLRAYCDQYFREDEDWVARLTWAARWLHDSPLKVRSTTFHEIVYALSDYGRGARASDLVLLEKDLASGALARRRENYGRLRKEFSDAPFFETLEEGVVPFAAPLFGPAEFLPRLAARLRADGWDAGVYRFDAARDLFEPNFVPCVPLPVGQDLGAARMDGLIESVRSEWRAFNGQR